MEDILVEEYVKLMTKRPVEGFISENVCLGGKSPICRGFMRGRRLVPKTTNEHQLAVR